MNILKNKKFNILIASILILIITNFNSTAQSFTYDSEDHNYEIKSAAGFEMGLKLTNSWSADYGGIYGRALNQQKVTEIRGGDNIPRIIVRNGNVGIGTDNPLQALQVTGNIASNGYLDLEKFILVGDVAKWSGNKDLSLKYSIVAEKGILSEKVKVALRSTGDWSDYVFEEDYEMMEINELEDYVSENKHLPNVPSAEEMVENGLDVAKMDAKLLEKIEEAYLYIIDLNKKVEGLAKENESLKTSLQGLSTSTK